ncbi:MAG: SRPBCC domain-containing protein [Saprospiraceae bacterium]|nr:SRPBCC domain-containing protein [Saprospiraceae bacterium]
MKDQIIQVERVFDASIKNVWRALTEKELMKKWYFDLAEFEPVLGFKFEFYGGHEEGIQYKHLCEITEVIPGAKLTYSWRYEGYSGNSYVSFELFEENEKTRLKLTHTGIASFPSDIPDFAIHNFAEGWNQIINQSLKEFLENNPS